MQLFPFCVRIPEREPPPESVVYHHDLVFRWFALNSVTLISLVRATEVFVFVLASSSHSCLTSFLCPSKTFLRKNKLFNVDVRLGRCFVFMIFRVLYRRSACLYRSISCNCCWPCSNILIIICGKFGFTDKASLTETTHIWLVAYGICGVVTSLQGTSLLVTAPLLASLMEVTLLETSRKRMALHCSEPCDFAILAPVDVSIVTGWHETRRYVHG